MVVRNFLTVYVLTDRTPTDRKSQNMGGLGYFGLGRPLALKEIPGPGRNRRNTISWCYGSQNGEKKCYHAIRDGCPQFFYILGFERPRGGKSQNTDFPGPVGLGQPLGTWRNSGPKTDKRNFPELGALLGGKSIRPKSFSQKVRNFFTFCVSADRTPTGGKSQNTGFWGTFGLGQPLGT